MYAIMIIIKPRSDNIAHISVPNEALMGMENVHFEICEICLLQENRISIEFELPITILIQAWYELIWLDTNKPRWRSPGKFWNWTMRVKHLYCT